MWAEGAPQLTSQQLSKDFPFCRGHNASSPETLLGEDKDTGYVSFVFY